MPDPAILLRFGAFEANSHTGELRNGGVPIKLPPQAFQVLVLLAGRPGELVTREDIRRALWPNDTVVEWEHSINTAVKRIRAALNDSREMPRYIETLSRRGYRFVGEVERIPLPTRPPDTPTGLALPPRPPDTPTPEAGLPALPVTPTPGGLLASPPAPTPGGLPGSSPAGPAAARTWTDPTGQIVSHYRVLNELGRGGMGIVYRAEDIRLGRLVALKFLPPGFDSDGAALARFEQEARSASLLNHPGLCTIYEVETHNGRTFIAMELLEGETLAARLAPKGSRLSTGELLDLAIQVADALDAAHERGLIHRDIKPGNIFLTLRGEAKVLDFGLAKAAPRRIAPGRAGVRDSDSTGGKDSAPGTLVYMSPEQARGEGLDARSDLYSFGLVLYEAATGQREIPRDRRPVLLLQSAAPDLPLRLCEIVGRLLENDRAMRFQSAADVASELRRLKRDESIIPAPAHPAVIEVPRKPVWNRRLAGALIAGAVVLAASYAIWRLAPSFHKDTPLVAERLTTDPGFQVAADFSPDGKQIAYCWNGSQAKKFDIYLLTLGGGQPRRFTTDDAENYSPAWSPDGRSIAFLSGPEDGVATLMAAPVAGGPARKISDTSMHVSALYRRIEWSRDGRWIIMEGENAPEEGYSLTAVSVETGERRKLTTAGRSQGDLQPAVSPDGRTLAYVKDVGNGVSVPFLLPLNPGMSANGEPRRLAFPGFQNVVIASPRWLPGGGDLIYVSNKGGPNRLWRASVNRGTGPVLLAALGEGVGFPVVSPDGKRLVFTRFSSGGSIWSTGTETSGPAPAKVIGSSQTDSLPDFSPDGMEIAFGSNRSGSPEIWVSGRNGERARQLTRYNGPITGSARWSPDGKWIVYDSRVEGQPDIYKIPAAGGAHVRLTTDPAADVSPIWSPDGRWIYFCSGRSGSRQIWRIPAAGGNAEQITRFGGCHPHPSPDGKALYYMKQAGIPVSAVWTVPAQGGEELLVVNNVVDRCIALYKNRLYFAARQSGELFPSLNYLDLSSHKKVLIRRLSEPLASELGVSPDGSTLLYHQLDRREGNLMLVTDLKN